MENIIGRTEEKALINKIKNSKEAELVAVYGRRRVGKTFLIRNEFRDKLVFEFSGIHHATLGQQLESFSYALTRAAETLPVAKPESWIAAFQMLTDFLKPTLSRGKRVIFFDEFPWINTPRSGFLAAFENFWNGWASNQKNLIVVICGSAAAWMIQKVLKNRGGLHNRVSRRIRLLPFNIAETKAFLRSRDVKLDQHQLLQIYMAMGGIPQYLKEVEPGESAAQAIDRICFTKDGLLQDEFKNLYYSLFDNAAQHIELIRALAQKGSGMNRNELIAAAKFSSGGGMTQLLEELTESGFITPYTPFGKTSRDNIYKLTDEYSLFYIRFIENTRSKGPGTWIKFSTGSAWKSWSGYAFESICMKHEHQLKKAMGIENVYTETSVWRYQPGSSDAGTQIDLVIDRNDACINICEIKFSIAPFEISRTYAAQLEQKLSIFAAQTKTRKTLFLTMITTHGVKNKEKYPGLVQRELGMDALFEL